MLDVHLADKTLGGRYRSPCRLTYCPGCWGLPLAVVGGHRSSNGELF